MERGDGRNPENLSLECKFAMVVETVAIDEAELVEYCRKKGLLTEKIATSRESCVQGDASADRPSQTASKEALKPKKIITISSLRQLTACCVT